MVPRGVPLAALYAAPPKAAVDSLEAAFKEGMLLLLGFDPRDKAKNFDGSRGDDIRRAFMMAQLFDRMDTSCAGLLSLDEVTNAL